MQITDPPACPLTGIALRQLTAADIAEWYAYLSIPQVFEHTSWNLDGPHALDLLVSQYESAGADSACRLAILDEHRGRLAGTIGLHAISTANRRAELAYDLAPEYWGRGIATASCRVVTTWAQMTLGLRRVQATVLESNARSERVLRKGGFTYEGMLHAYRMVRGVPGNFKMYARVAGGSTGTFE